MQMQKSTKRNAADLIELARNNIEGLKDYTLSGTITHIYRQVADRGLPWATDDVEKMALDAMDSAVIEWEQKTGQSRGMMTALALVTAAQKDGHDLFAKALSLLREKLEIRNLGEADPRPYEAEVLKFFGEVIDPTGWSRVSITLRGTLGGYNKTYPPWPAGINVHEITDRVAHLVIQAYRDLGSGPQGVTIQFH
jgi:hypothetical protein